MTISQVAVYQLCVACKKFGVCDFLYISLWHESPKHLLPDFRQKINKNFKNFLHEKNYKNRCKGSNCYKGSNSGAGSCSYLKIKKRLYADVIIMAVNGNV
jgi:hypothetical protein